MIPSECSGNRGLQSRHDRTSPCLNVNASRSATPGLSMAVRHEQDVDQAVLDQLVADDDEIPPVLIGVHVATANKPRGTRDFEAVVCRWSVGDSTAAKCAQPFESLFRVPGVDGAERPRYGRQRHTAPTAARTCSSVSGDRRARGCATASATLTRQPCSPAFPHDTVSMSASYPASSRSGLYGHGDERMDRMSAVTHRLVFGGAPASGRGRGREWSGSDWDRWSKRWSYALAWFGPPLGRHSSRTPGWGVGDCLKSRPGLSPSSGSSRPGRPQACAAETGGFNPTSEQLTVVYSGAVDAVLRDADTSRRRFSGTSCTTWRSDPGWMPARWSRTSVRYRESLGGS